MAATIKNVIVLGTATSINLATITAAPTAFADSLQVRWQPSDQAVFLALSKPNKSLDRSTRTSAESTSIGESSLHMPLPSVNSSVSNDTATSLYWPSRTWKSSSASKESLDIQIRAKTGIGVGMTVGASIVALVAIIFLWKRKGQKGRRSQARIAGATDNQINCQGHSRGANLSGSGGQEDKAALKTCGADGKARLE
jgi:hypothetical protein